MDVQRILEFADLLDQLDPSVFKMDAWLDDDVWLYGGPVTCNTTACIAGHAVFMFGSKADYCNFMEKPSSAEGIGQRLLGLTESQANDLFQDYPAYGGIMPSQAARVLRHLAQTDEVDWKIINT